MWTRSYCCSPMGHRLCSGEAVISYKCLTSMLPVLAIVADVERVALPGFFHTVPLHMGTWTLRYIVFCRVLNLVALYPGSCFIQMVETFLWLSISKQCKDQENVISIRLGCFQEYCELCVWKSAFYCPAPWFETLESFESHYLPGWSCGVSVCHPLNHLSKEKRHVYLLAVHLYWSK